MALVNHRKKFIYLMEPHTASRAVVECLKRCVPGTAEVGHHHITMEHLTDWRRQHLDGRMIKNYRIICTVRNPFETLITRWLPRADQYKSLEDFIDTVWDSDLAAPARELNQSASHFNWYEDLEKDLQWMFSNSKLTLAYNPKHKTPDKNHWSTYFTPELALKVSSRSDWLGYMQRFGYVLNNEGEVKVDRANRLKFCKPL